jgi:transcriptional regulator with XRE-family HTH domain
MPKKYIPTNVGFILNDLRLKSNKTQYRLEKDLNYSRESIDAIENMRTNPSLHSFIKIFEYLGYEIHIVDKKTKEKVTALKIIEDN